ncbi:MAG: hypothetical protein SOV43_01440 [Selenomonadaceae bacterium]|nr:hypothetical protein [Selenomonadaceae bacterium]
MRKKIAVFRAAALALLALFLLFAAPQAAMAEEAAPQAAAEQMPKQVLLHDSLTIEPFLQAYNAACPAYKVVGLSHRAQGTDVVYIASMDEDTALLVSATQENRLSHLMILHRGAVDAAVQEKLAAITGGVLSALGRKQDAESRAHLEASLTELKLSADTPVEAVYLPDTAYLGRLFSLTRSRNAARNLVTILLEAEEAPAQTQAASSAGKECPNS